MKLKSILACLSVLFLITCAPEPVRVSQITLNTKALTLAVGESEKLTATVSPFNADNPTIIWSSDNASIAKVSDGTVTAVSPGTAKITAKADDGGMSDACVVTVLMPVKGVSLDRTTLSMYEGGTDQLVATVTPENADDASLLWTSSAPDVVLVTTEGKLLALAPGKADITVTTVDGGFSAACKVTVQEVKMELKPPTLDILIGDSSDIQVTLENQLEGVSVNIRWYSTDESIVTVDDKGHVKALALGDAVICAATDKGKTAFCKIHVRDRVQYIEVSASSAEVIIGETLQLEVQVTPANLPDVEIKWTTSNTNIATVNSSGLVKTAAKGKVTITATIINGSESKSATYEITVVQPVTSISVNPKSLEIFVGDTIKIGKDLEVQVGPADADVATWRYGFSASDIISLEGDVITGLKAGKVTLSVIADKSRPKDLTDKCTITVKAKVASLTISGDDTRTIQVGTSVKLTASVKPSNANQEVTWTSSSPEIATVDENGNVKGIKEGETTITAASKENPEIKATCKIVVENVPVESVSLNKSSLTLVEGKTEKLTATVKPDNVLEKTVSWSSSNPDVASVSSSGLVSALAEGTSTITAACGGKSATCLVTVEPQVIHVTGVTLNQTSATLEAGKGLQLLATVLPEKATNKAITWSSSNLSVARVDEFGKVTTIGVGTATITVTTVDGGKTATCSLTVTTPPVHVSSISLSYSSYTLVYGQTLDLSNAEVLPADATDKTIIWSSSDSSIASVTDGIVKAASKAGTVAIKASSQSDPSVEATCMITVKSQIVLVSKVTISPSSLKMYLNSTTKLTATVSPSNADNKNVKWTTPQGAVTTVDQNGNVKAVSVGVSRIIATSEDGNAQDWIQVTVTKNAVSKVTMSKPELTLKAGETYDLTAVVTPEDSTAPASIPGVTWTSSDPSKATVNQSGRVTAVAAGTTTVTATSKDNKSITATCIVTVLASEVGTGGAEGAGFEDWNF